MITQEYRVAGMTCGHCVEAVTGEVSKLDGVAGVAIDLTTGTVTVQSVEPLDQSVVVAAIDGAGFDLAP